MSRRWRRPSRRGGHEEWRDWPNLPSLVVDDIAGRLLRHGVAEYILLRAACKELRKRTADPRREGGSDLDARFRPRHWMMRSKGIYGDGDDADGDDGRRQFLNLTECGRVRIDLPELATHHLEASVEGLLLLRDAASHAARLLNPFTRALVDLPPITPDLGAAYAAWAGPSSADSASRAVYAGISDETSPPTVMLHMGSRTIDSVIAYARPGDERWAAMDLERCRSVPASPRCSSVLTRRGRVYFEMPGGNVLAWVGASAGREAALEPVPQREALPRRSRLLELILRYSNKHTEKPGRQSLALTVVP